MGKQKHNVQKPKRGPQDVKFSIFSEWQKQKVLYMAFISHLPHSKKDTTETSMLRDAARMLIILQMKLN